MSTDERHGRPVRRTPVVLAVLLVLAGAAALIVGLTSQVHAPQPPASAARTVSVFRIHPMPVVIAISTYSFASRLSNPGSIPTTRPPAVFAPRLTASITPESPPVTTMPLRSAMRRPTSSAMRSAFSGTGSRGSLALLPMTVIRTGRFKVR